MIFESVVHIWTCAECSNAKPAKMWKWEINVNKNDVFDRQKLQYMEMTITNHVIRSGHEVTHRQNEAKYGGIDGEKFGV